MVLLQKTKQNKTKQNKTKQKQKQNQDVSCNAKRQGMFQRTKAGTRKGALKNIIENTVLPFRAIDNNINNKTRQTLRVDS